MVIVLDGDGKLVRWSSGAMHFHIDRFQPVPETDLEINKNWGMF